MTPTATADAEHRRRYHQLWQRADRLLRQADPCRFQEGVCSGGLQDGCCLCDHHLPGQPCSLCSLACKLHLCFEVQRNHPLLTFALWSIEQEARALGLPLELFSTLP